MTFEEYLRSLPNDKRLEILRLFENHGEANAVLSELAAIQPCVQNKKLDVRINHKYFFWHRNKAFLSAAHTTLFTIGAIKYCYYGYGDGGKIGLIGNNGVHVEFSAQNDQDSTRVYDQLRSHVKGFEATKLCDSKDRAVEVKVRAGIHMKAFYVLKNNAIYLVRTVPFIGTQEIVKAPSIDEIIWCMQLLEIDSECGESNIVELYFLRQKEPCSLYFQSGCAAFQFVLELKKRVPHLLYGHNKEYEEIYKADPAGLLAKAKQLLVR